MEFSTNGWMRVVDAGIKGRWHRVAKMGICGVVGRYRLRTATRALRASTALNRMIRSQKSARFPDSVANFITSSRAFQASGPAPAEPSGRNSKIESLLGS